jgi:hypothetical protein
MFGKIINGRLQVVGNIIKTDKGTITNPKAEQLIELGYKEIEYTEKPEYDKDEEKLQEVYTDGDKITVSYEKVALTDEEHNEIIKQEIVEEEQKITARNIRNAIKGDSFALGKIDEVEGNIAELRAKIREITNEE